MRRRSGMGRSVNFTKPRSKFLSARRESDCTLATVSAGLTPAELVGLQAEADAGDRLGQMVVSGPRRADAFATGEHIYALHVVEDAAGTAEVLE